LGAWKLFRAIHRLRQGCKICSVMRKTLATPGPFGKWPARARFTSPAAKSASRFARALVPLLSPQRQGLRSGTLAACSKAQQQQNHPGPDFSQLRFCPAISLATCCCTSGFSGNSSNWAKGTTGNCSVTRWTCRCC